ncbi:MAG: enolase C-terminal domain-like protein [Woeseiaceae bacterium]
MEFSNVSVIVGRFNATEVGGISKALELLMIANDAGLPIEIQSWGHSLAQAASLHLMLANERTRYFEAAAMSTLLSWALDSPGCGQPITCRSPILVVRSP